MPPIAQLDLGELADRAAGEGAIIEDRARSISAAVPSDHDTCSAEGPIAHGGNSAGLVTFIRSTPAMSA
jgi:hypothetical protein